MKFFINIVCLAHRLYGEKSPGEGGGRIFVLSNTLKMCNFESVGIKFVMCFIAVQNVKRFAQFCVLQNATQTFFSK